MAHRINANSQVPPDQWYQFFDDFGHDNVGRLVTIEAFGGTFGDEQLAKAVPLLSVNYDPRDKGDNLRISTGRKEVEYEHRVASPQEVWVADDEQGRSSAIEIIGQNGDHTIVSIGQ